MSVTKRKAVSFKEMAGPAVVVWGRKIILIRLQQLLRNMLDSKRNVV